jgi:uncharacterized membrane protein required for colicin V production
VIRGLDLLDLILVVVVALGGLHGYRTGLVRQITRLFGTVIAYAVALWMRPVVAPWLRSTGLVPHVPAPVGLFMGDVANAVAFIVVFVVSFALLRYAAGLVDTLFNLPVLSMVNRLGGMVLGLALSVVFVYVLVIAAHLVHNDRLQGQLAHSDIANWLLHATPSSLTPGGRTPADTT